MRNLLRRLAARQRTLIGACLVLLAGFEFLLCAIVASIDISQVLGQAMAVAPPIFRAMIEQAGLMAGGGSGMLAFGWNHPIAHAIVAAVAVTLATRAVAGEIENGAIELVLAQPVSRMRYIAAQIMFAAIAIVAVDLGAVLATAMGQHVFDLPRFPPATLALLLANLVLLQGAMYALTLLFSVFGREAGRVALGGFLVVVVSYFVDTVASLWPAAAFLEPYTLHAWYDPNAVLVQGVLSGRAVAVLGSITAAALVAAAWRFRTRDLP
jgi:ABC-2 type transport system permease protein